MLQIQNGRVLTMAGKTFENGQVLIENGKIKSVGEYLSIPNAKAEVIDARGGWILPGLIEAHCHIGITEEKKGFEGDDCNEVNQPVIPYLKALDAVNPMDSAFHNALSAGITAVMVGPGGFQCGGRPVFGHEDPWPGDGSDGCQRTGGDESSLWRKSKNKLQRTEQSSVHPYVRRGAAAG